MRKIAIRAASDKPFELLEEALEDMGYRPTSVKHGLTLSKHINGGNVNVVVQSARVSVVKRTKENPYVTEKSFSMALPPVWATGETRYDERTFLQRVRMYEQELTLAK